MVFLQHLPGQQSALSEKGRPYPLFSKYHRFYVRQPVGMSLYILKTADLSQLTVEESKRDGDDLANMLNLGKAVFNDSIEYHIKGNLKPRPP